MPTDKPKNPTKATTGGVSWDKVGEIAKKMAMAEPLIGSNITFLESMMGPNKEDDLNEDAMEVMDLSGMHSWDDAYRAYNRWQESDDTLPDFWDAVDMITAVPVVGKAGKVAKGFNIAKNTGKTLKFKDFVNMVGKTLNRADFVQDVTTTEEAENGKTYMPSGYFDEAIINARKELEPIQETTRVPYMASPVYNLKVYN